MFSNLTKKKTNNMNNLNYIINGLMTKLVIVKYFNCIFV